jgi:hypothetical protein
MSAPPPLIFADRDSNGQLHPTVASVSAQQDWYTQQGAGPPGAEAAGWAMLFKWSFIAGIIATPTVFAVHAAQRTESAALVALATATAPVIISLWSMYRYRDDIATYPYLKMRRYTHTAKRAAAPLLAWTVFAHVAINTSWISDKVAEGTKINRFMASGADEITARQRANKFPQ